MSEAELDATHAATLARLTAILEPEATPVENAAAPAEAIAAEAAAMPDMTEPGDELSGVELGADRAATLDEPVPAVSAEIAETYVVAGAGTPASGPVAVELGGRRHGQHPEGSIRTTPPIVVIGDEQRNGFASMPVEQARIFLDGGSPVAVHLDEAQIPAAPARDEAPIPAAPARDEAPIPEAPARDEAPAWDEAPEPPALATAAPAPEPVVRAEMHGADTPPTTSATLASRPVVAPAAVRPPAPTRPRPVGSPGRGNLAALPARGAVAVIASCPYCAVLLEPPPESNRRCVRCRQRIMVKRLQGRAVYLTEAAVEVFEAERRRVANLGHWTRERERWLKLAASVGAAAGRIGRLERAGLSAEVVAAARSLYETTVDRRVRVARRGRRWDEASRLYLDQALALYRMAGSALPPHDDVVALHREGTLAALRGLGDIAKDAALIGSDCCESCRADDGHSFRISRELRDPRLPHPECPKGLCRCRWDLTTRDRDLVGGYLRRHVRPNRATTLSQPSRTARGFGGQQGPGGDPGADPAFVHGTISD